jgi:hypothetical protein
MNNTMPNLATSKRTVIADLTTGKWYVDHEAKRVFTICDLKCVYNSKQVIPGIVVTSEKITPTMFYTDATVVVTEVDSPSGIHWDK